MVAVMKANEVEYRTKKKRREGAGQPRQVVIKKKRVWTGGQMCITASGKPPGARPLPGVPVVYNHVTDRNSVDAGNIRPQRG